MKKDFQKVQQYFKEKSAEMTAFLQGLVEVESPSADPAAQAPIFSVIQKKLTELEFATTHFPGHRSGGYLMAMPRQRPRNNPLQLVLGHCDTVWSKGTLANMPVEEANGRMKGPGIFDMKAGLTQMVFALQAIRDLDLKMKVTPVCLINSDEETGSRDSTVAIRRLARIADRAFVLEPPLGLEGKLKTARKGLGRFTLTVKGVAAHAGLNPGDGASAILELSHQIQHLFSFNDPDKGITVNVGMIEGGVSPNVIAPESKAIIDVRVPTMEEAYLVEEKILSLQPYLLNTKVEVEGGFGRLPMEKNQRNEKLWNAAQYIGHAMGIDLRDAPAGGGSDANTTSLYTATLDGLGTTGDGAHAAHEFIFLDKMQERAALLVFLLLLPPVKPFHLN